MTKKLNISFLTASAALSIKIFKEECAADFPVWGRLSSRSRLAQIAVWREMGVHAAFDAYEFQVYSGLNELGGDCEKELVERKKAAFVRYRNRFSDLLPEFVANKLKCDNEIVKLDGIKAALSNKLLGWSELSSVHGEVFYSFWNDGVIVLKLSGASLDQFIASISYFDKLPSGPSDRHAGLHGILAGIFPHGTPNEHLIVGEVLRHALDFGRFDPAKSRAEV